MQKPASVVGVTGQYWANEDEHQGMIFVAWGPVSADGGTPDKWIVSIDGVQVAEETSGATAETGASYFYENIYTAGEHTISVVASNSAGSSDASTASFNLTEEQAGQKAGTPTASPSTAPESTTTPEPTANSTPDSTGDFLNFESLKAAGSIETYRSQDDSNSPGWGGDSNVAFNFSGTSAVISADSFGSNAWAVQLKIKNLTSAEENNVFEFDVISTIDKNIVYKNENSTATETISLKAGESKHLAFNVTGTTFNTTFDLTGGGAGSLTFSNMKYAPGTVEIPKPSVSPLPEGESYVLFDAVEHSDYSDGTDTVVSYSGKTATISGADWGGEYGGDSKWQIQLKTLVPVVSGTTYHFSFKIKSEVSRSFFIKLGDLNNDGTVYYEGTESLEAGVEKTVTGVTTKPVDIDTLMVLFALGDQAPATQNTITISDLALYSDGGEYVDTTPYINFEKLDHSHDTLDSVDVAITYTNGGKTITATGADWGSDWGGDSKWQIQLKELIPVTASDTYDFSFKIKSEVARNVFLKLGDVNQDGTVFFEQDIALEAGVEKTVTGTTTKPVDIDTLMVLFALGDQNGAVQNTITISDLWLKGQTSGYVVSGGSSSAPTEKGKEYDFSAAEDNAANDYADPGTAKAGYELIWSDEFDGNYGGNVDANTGLNLDNWAYQLGDGTTDCSNPGWGNNELQAYTKEKKNIGVNEDLSGDGQADGLLRITAAHEESGYKYETESSKNYTSARIRTTSPSGALFTTTYGYVEARISLPETQGAWPAFWMLPESTSIYGGWPVSGELDIMETTGTNASAACGTLHWGAPDHVYKGSGYVTLDSEIAYFHTYAVDWEPNSITWYYDGKPIYTSYNWESGNAGASDKTSFDAPFDQPFYVLLNLAVDSGQFGGSANRANFTDDINMYVDYVRVYQKTDGYPAYGEKTASGSAAQDWTSFAGQNQIAGITAGCISDNMVGESDHTLDNSKWYLSTNANGTGGVATGETTTDASGKTWAKLNITEAGSQDYSVQLIGHYDAKAGYVYKVSFDIYGEGDIAGKKVNCDSKEWSGWSTYGIQSFNLPATATTVSYLFEQTEDFEDCRIEFNLGAAGTGTVYIGNVKVEIVDPTLLGGEVDSGSRSALADGNVIYNGTFDQGSKHVGYWSVYDGTTMTVPRYTTEKLDAADVSVVDVASKTNYEKIADGIKYYERRAQISAASGRNPVIYQSGFKMPADTYTLSFDMYSKADTNVSVGIFTTDADGNLNVLDQISGSSVKYEAADGVKTLGLKLELTEDIENAALVMTFDVGAQVQVDNVSLIGAGLGVQADPNPVTGTTGWTADNGSGTALQLSSADGVYTLAGVQSGANWYAPQIISENFQLIAGKQYELSFKYKLSGTSNNTFQYIIQENNGSWHVYNGGPTTVECSPEADADGFATYTVKFTADVSLDTVHLVFGLGNSGCAGAADFSFKDVDLHLVEIGGGEGGGSGTSDPWTDEEENILGAPEITTSDETETDVKVDFGSLDVTKLPEVQALVANGTHTVEVAVVQDVASAADVAKLNVEVGKESGFTSVQSFDIDMLLIIDGNNNGATQITDNFGYIDLALNIGKEYAGRSAIVYQLHDGSEIIKYGPLTVDANGNVVIQVNKLSTFTVAVEEKTNEGGDNPGGSGGNNDNPGSGSGTPGGNSSTAKPSGSSGTSSSSGQSQVKAEPITYTVVRGDNLSKIAKRFGITLRELLANNPQIKNPNRIYPGQVIYIQLGDLSEEELAAAKEASENVYYIVKKGDCLYKIAKKHHMTLKALYTLNPAYLKRKYIYAGEKIRVK